MPLSAHLSMKGLCVHSVPSSSLVPRPFPLFLSALPLTLSPSVLLKFYNVSFIQSFSTTGLPILYESLFLFSVLFTLHSFQMTMHYVLPGSVITFQTVFFGTSRNLVLFITFINCQFTKKIIHAIFLMNFSQPYLKLISTGNNNSFHSLE